MVPLLGRTSRTISKYGSLFFGNKLPNSFILSFILNLLRRSTEIKKKDYYTYGCIGLIKYDNTLISKQLYK